MNSETIFKAIGNIDDELINEPETCIKERTERRKKTCLILSAAACLLIATVISSALFVLQVPDYSFSSDELKTLCEKGLSPGSTVLTEAPSLQAPPAETPDEINPSGVVLETMIGANAPEIHYANEKYVVFSVYNGFFVYDYTEDKILNSVSTEKLGVPNFGQGSEISTINVTLDGKYAIITSVYDLYEEQDYGSRFEYRKTDLFTGKTTLIDRETAEKISYYDLGTVIDDSMNTQSSYRSVYFGSIFTAPISGTQKHCRMGVARPFVIGNTELHITDSETHITETYRVFGSVGD